MKRISTVILALTLILPLTACKGNTATAQSEQNSITAEQNFSPDYSLAESIEITVFGGTATGQSYIVRRTDDKMMWSRNEFLSKYDQTKPNQPFLSDPTFSNPDEYLFDALIEAIFGDREFTLTAPLMDADEFGRHSIVFYDNTGADIIAFDLIYPNDQTHYLRFNETFYMISSVIDSAPFSASYFMNR